MKLSQVALQLYTLRDYLQTPADIARTLKKVAALGYRAVQVSAMGPIAESELRTILDGEGLHCCATHEDAQIIRTQPERVVERLQRLHCTHTAYPFPVGVDWTKPADIDRLIFDLDRAGEVLRRAGLILAYHNHAIEFMPYRGTTALAEIYARTRPENLHAELDTYWIQYGGGNPAAWCRRLSGRLPLLHLKDYAIAAPGTPTFASIGSGNLDWPEIVAAADAAGCRWFIVEQDTCPGDLFDAVRKSLEHITEHLVSE